MPAPREASHTHAAATDARSAARRLRRIAAAAGGVVAGLALAWLHATGTPLRLHLILAVSSAIILTFALAGVLMSLLFLSSRSGIDGEADGSFRE